MYTLEPYQERGVQEANALLTKHDAIIYQLATGGGKTVVFSAISHRYTSYLPYNVLILVHRVELLNQTRKTLYKGFGVTGMPVKAGMRYIPESRVYVGMVDTVYKRLDKFASKNIGLVIVDEAHLGHFKKIRKALPGVKTIGFTATPLATTKADPLKNYYSEIVCGIDIPDLIELNKTKQDRGLVQNITFNPKEIVDKAALSMDRVGNDYDTTVMAKEYSKPKYVKGVVDTYENQKHGTRGTKAIVFNCNVAHSKLVVEEFNNRGYRCRHIDGDSDSEIGKGYRADTWKWFRETPGAILCNVDVATAGVDEPTIETVIVNRSTTSLTKWLQMCGRGARPAYLEHLEAWKTSFYIIDMGGHVMGKNALGDWCDARDWRDIFHNPEKPKEGKGNAPVKDCPECDAIVPAQALTCRFCGYEFPRKAPAPEGPIGEFVVVTRGINVGEIINKNKHRREHAIFLGIGTMLADSAKSVIPEMNTEHAQFILEKYHEKAREWAAQSGKDYNEWYQTRAKEHLYSQLKKQYVTWNPKLNTVPSTS